jgi:transposase
LERHRVIDLLPDRTSETVKVWLQGHPEIEVISRDRASSYADAARQGAPQATQVADRFHLTKNVREKLKDLLDRKRTCLPYVEESTVQSAPAAFSISQEMGTLGEVVMPEHVQDMSPANAAIPDQLDEAGSSPMLTVSEWRRKLNREKRYALYEDVPAHRLNLNESPRSGASTLLLRFQEAQHHPTRLQ